MSKYTTEVRYLCEAFSGFTPEQMIDKGPMEFARAARDRIFDPSIVIGDAEYSNRIKELILVHYYTREICEETFGLWKMRINQRLREKERYYTELYDTMALQAGIGNDPYMDVDLTVSRGTVDQGTRSGSDSLMKTGSGTAFSDTVSDSRMDKSGADTQTTDYGKTVTDEKQDDETGYNLHSDTPEGGVEGINAVLTGLEGSGFLSDAQKQTSTASSTRSEEQGGTDVDTTVYGHEVSEQSHTHNESGDSRNYRDDKSFAEAHNRSEESTERQTGKRGRSSLMTLLTEYRDKLLNLDERIIYDMRDLFLMLW